MGFSARAAWLDLPVALVISAVVAYYALRLLMS
jgi:hypothetical protein